MDPGDLFLKKVEKIPYLQKEISLSILVISTLFRATPGKEVIQKGTLTCLVQQVTTK